MNHLNAREESLRRAKATLHAQLALLPRDDARRRALYRELLWCYHESFALVSVRVAAWRAAQRPSRRQPPDANH
jgi:hypothetical protein